MTTNDSTGWSFTDLFDPHIYWDGTESFPIDSPTDLERVLREYSIKPPRLVVIRTPAAGKFFMGLGGDLAGLIYYPWPASDRGIFALPRVQVTNNDGRFVSEGEPFTFHAANLMPVETAIDIILYFFKSGELSPSVNWA